MARGRDARNGAALGGLAVIGLLPVIGRILPPTLAWGFHHTAYLPLWVSAILLLGWLLLWIPRWRDPLDRALFGAAGRWLFEGSALRPLAVAALATAAFVILRTPVHLLGDGVLVGELVAKGSPFRAHDAMDYLLHRAAFRLLGTPDSAPDSFRIYAIGSWIAGSVAVLLALLLLRRSRLAVPQKLVVFSLWLLAAPTLLFCGYVESYGYLAVAMAGFLWSGAMAQRGEVSPWVPGVFYGFALFFHTTALFAAPALLWLAWRPAPAGVRRGRWAASLLLPALLLPVLAAVIHVAAGYDGDWFRREFLESKNQKRVLIPWTGPHGFFSLTNAKDLLNWLLLAVPVTGWLIGLRLRRQPGTDRLPERSLLLVQAAGFVIPFLFLDRKLGASRDWDLLAAHVAGFPWLAAALWNEELRAAPEPPGKVLSPPSLRFAAVWVALLVGIPWFAVNARTEASLRRFDEMRRDFATHPRAYAAEELAKYFRDHGDIRKSLGLYEECVRTFPHNARTRVLLGTNYLMLGRLAEASAQYEKALEIDPDNWMALDMKAKLAWRDNDFAEALEVYRRLAPLRGSDPAVWGAYGAAAMERGEYSEAYDAFAKALALRPDATVSYHMGIAAAYLKRWDAAIRAMLTVTREAPNDAKAIHALAATYEARFADCLARGQQADRADLEQALLLARKARSLAPDDSRLASYTRHLEAVLAGREPPTNEMHP